MLTAHQARTSLALGTAGAALIAAWLLSPGSPPPAYSPTAQSSNILVAKLASTKILVGQHEQDIAVTITMPKGRAHVRPPLSLAIVIDRSGSMEGEPLANAKAAAAKLIDQLAAGDAFSIVTYSSSVETVMEMSRASAANKQAARAAIEQIFSDGNTCISCGIEQASTQLAQSPIHGGLSRMVVISDGQANSGIYDRDELAQLATETAAKGVSISTVGVGLDFDEVTMARLADVGHGHYYFVEDTQALGQMFKTELDGMSATVAADVRLTVGGVDANILDAYGYPVVDRFRTPCGSAARPGNAGTCDRGREGFTIPIADLREGETRKVVLRAYVPDTASSKIEVAKFSLEWRDVATGLPGRANTNLLATITTDVDAVAASIDRNAVNAIESARTARVLEDATKVYETQGADAAQMVIERHMREVNANKNIDAPAMQAIQSATSGASSNFAKAPPAKAMKATRMDAYDLAR